jgi:hypothetical protein
MSISRSRCVGELRPSITEAQHTTVESAVMAAQIEQLPDLSGYLKLASGPAWRRVTLPVPAPVRAAQPRTLSAQQVSAPAAAQGEALPLRDGFGAE